MANAGYRKSIQDLYNLIDELEKRVEKLEKLDELPDDLPPWDVEK